MNAHCRSVVAPIPIAPVLERARHLAAQTKDGAMVYRALRSDGYAYAEARAAVRKLREFGIVAPARYRGTSYVSDHHGLPKDAEPLSIPANEVRDQFLRLARANVLHLVDLKRAGHSPRQTERVHAVHVDRAAPAKAISPAPVPEAPSALAPPPATPPILPAPATDDPTLTVIKTTAPASIARIQTVVAEHYAVTRADIVSHSRLVHFVRPRHVAMYLSRTLTSHSFPVIGGKFGNRDHTTLLHGARKIERLIATDPDLAETVRVLRARVMA